MCVKYSTYDSKQTLYITALYRKGYDLNGNNLRNVPTFHCCLLGTFKQRARASNASLGHSDGHTNYDTQQTGFPPGRRQPRLYENIVIYGPLAHCIRRMAGLDNGAPPSRARPRPPAPVAVVSLRLGGAPCAWRQLQEQEVQYQLIS